MKPRLWIEGKSLLLNGWLKGVKYRVEWIEDTLIYTKDNDGTRKVAGTDTRPIIDTNNINLLKVQLIGEMVNIKLDDLTIKITRI